ncbi:MAG TPA: hypothetical protein VNA89_06515, partial [Gemmatimonadaceae bacterium]|nr:hypothetical protein [Gemmatimonadaceae bacterium]
MNSCRTAAAAGQVVLLVAHHVGVYPAGVRGADLHPLVRDLEPQRVAELLDAALRRRVGRDPRHRGHRRRRGDEQVVAAPGRHLRQRRRHGAHDADEVDLDHPRQRRHRRDRQRAVVGDAGVGDDDVDPAERLYRPVHGALERPLIGDVALEPAVARPQLARQRRQPL